MEQKTVQFLSFWKSLINGYKSTSEVPCIYTSKVLFSLDDDRIVQRLKHAYCMVLSDKDQDRVTAEKMVTPEAPIRPKLPMTRLLPRRGSISLANELNDWTGSREGRRMT